MSHAVEVNRDARDFGIMTLLTVCIVAGVVVTSVVPATAQSAPSSLAGTAEPTPEQVKTLLQLLSDPVVKGWIEREMQAASAPQAQTPGLACAEASVSGFVEWRLQVWQEHLRGLAEALPGLSGGGRVRDGTAVGGSSRAAGSPGPVCCWPRSSASASVWNGCSLGPPLDFRSRIESVRPTTVGERIRLVLSRFLLELVRVLCFAGGSIGAFLLFTWPPQLRHLVLGYLFAFLMLRVTARAVPLPVRTGACGASSGADERCRGVVLAALDRRLRRLVRGGLRHHPAPPPAWHERARCGDPGLCALARSPVDRPAHRVAPGLLHGRPRRRDGAGRADLGRLGGRRPIRAVGSDRCGVAAGGAPGDASRRDPSVPAGGEPGPGGRGGARLGLGCGGRLGRPRAVDHRRDLGAGLGLAAGPGRARRT